MKRYIPNTLTCGNLLSGCIATYFAFEGQYAAAFLCVIIGAVFDFFDGFVARWLHVSSEIGKELDSLADDITFSLAPATVVFAMIRETLDPTHLPAGFVWADSPILPYIPFVAFIMAAFGALRLAKFNIDKRQATTFIGLPTPANALFWCSLAVGLSENAWLAGEPWIAILLILGVFVASWLQVAEIPMFALKFKTYRWVGNEIRYCFLICAVFLLAILGWVGFSSVIVLYIITSYLNNKIGTRIARTE